MEKFCKNCGTKLAPGAKFCPVCGQKVTYTPENMQQYPEQQGYLQQPNYAGPKPDYIASNGQKHSKPGRKGVGILNIFLVVVMLVESVLVCFWKPGLLRSGSTSQEPEVFVGIVDDTSDEYILTDEELENIKNTEKIVSGTSDIRFDEKAYKKTPEKAKVSAEQNEVKFQSGVTVSFDDFCLSDETQELELRTLGTVSDDAYEAVGFDLLLDGKSAEFDGLAKVTVPYDPSWGDNIFIQYLNEDTGEWEILYTETDGAGNATFYTDHFCTYAAFVDLVSKGGGQNADGDIIEFHRPNSISIGDDGKLLLTATVNWPALAKQVANAKNIMDKDMSMLRNAEDPYWVDRGLTVINNTGTGADYYIKTQAFLTKSPYAETLLNGISEKLGAAGHILTFAKLAYQWNQDGWDKAIKSNWKDLASMGAALSGKAIGGTVGSFASIACIAYYGLSMIDSVATNIELKGNGSTEEYAYRLFTNTFLTYNPATSKINYRYVPLIRNEYGNLVEDPIISANTPYQKGEFPLKSGAGNGGVDNWRIVIARARALDAAGRISAMDYIKGIVYNYCNLFWRIQNTYAAKDFLKTTKFGNYFGGTLADSYKEPDRNTKYKYYMQYQKALFSWLEPYLRNEVKKEYSSLLNSTFAAYQELEKELNKKITVYLKDSSTEYFTDSEYYGYPIGLSVSENERFACTFNDDLGGRLDMTVAGWLNAGSPTVLRVLGEKKPAFDYMPGEAIDNPDTWDWDTNKLVMHVKLKSPETTIVLEPSNENYDITSFIGHWSQDDNEVPGQLIITDHSIRRYYANYDDLNTVRAFDTGEREIISYEVNGNELSIIVDLQKQQDWVRSKCRIRLKDKDHIEVFWGEKADADTPSYAMIRVPSK